MFQRENQLDQHFLSLACHTAVDKYSRVAVPGTCHRDVVSVSRHALPLLLYRPCVIGTPPTHLCDTGFCFIPRGLSGGVFAGLRSLEVRGRGGGGQEIQLPVRCHHQFCAHHSTVHQVTVSLIHVPSSAQEWVLPLSSRQKGHIAGIKGLKIDV